MIVIGLLLGLGGVLAVVVLATAFLLELVDEARYRWAQHHERRASR